MNFIKQLLKDLIILPIVIILQLALHFAFLGIAVLLVGFPAITLLSMSAMLNLDMDLTGAIIIGEMFAVLLVYRVLQLGGFDELIDQYLLLRDTIGGIGQ